MTGATPLPAAIRAIVIADVSRMLRDRFLKGMALYILFISVLMRWGVPWLTTGVQTRWSFDLVPYHPLITSYLAVLLGAVMIGIIGGFLMLETREERTVRALLVSPLSTTHYLVIMSGVMMCLAVGVSLLQAFIIGVGLPDFVPLLASAALVSPMARIVAFFLAAFADNRVEGFVQEKFERTMGAVAAGAWIVPEPWQFREGIGPPYRGVKANWVAVARGSG